MRGFVVVFLFPQLCYFRYNRHLLEFYLCVFDMLCVCVTGRKIKDLGTIKIKKACKFILNNLNDVPLKFLNFSVVLCTYLNYK